ncbi:unnamed protein product, partial [Gadus morhua 'NCC']
MFKQQLDDVLDRSMSEDSDADWEPQSQTGRPPAPTPTEGGRERSGSVSSHDNISIWPYQMNV